MYTPLLKQRSLETQPDDLATNKTKPTQQYITYTERKPDKNEKT